MIHGYWAGASSQETVLTGSISMIYTAWPGETRASGLCIIYRGPKADTDHRTLIIEERRKEYDC